MPTSSELVARRKATEAWDDHMRQARAAETARLEAERLQALQPVAEPQPEAPAEEENDG